MNVLCKYPTRQRPQLAMQQVTRLLADPVARILLSIDADDVTMNNPEMLAWLDAQPRLKYRIGNSKSKVEACNDGLAEEDFELVILCSDDMVPQRSDYAARIAELFQQHLPEGDGVLHLNDGRVGKVLNTICVCDYAYFMRNGRVLYRECYVSTHCDNEWQEVSERLGRAVYVDEVILFHNWVGTSAPDSLHRKNELHYAADCRTFRGRKKAGFPK